MEQKEPVGSEERATAAPVTCNFDVAMKLQADGDPVHHEPVKTADQLDLHSEVWLEHLRRGQPGLALEDLLIRILPAVAHPESNRCEGLLVEATGPSGETVSRRFGHHAVSRVAARGAERMLKSGLLQPNQNYYFEIVTRQEESETNKSVDVASGIGGSLTVRHAPLAYRTHSLAPLLAQSDAVGPVEHWCPIFYSHDVFLRAERCSRRGAAKQPPEESGAVILGQLCSCPETGEFFLVATDVIELEDARQRTYSLAFSSRTWGRIQEEVRARQDRPATRAERIIGQCHGHNFYPCMLEARDCRTCEKRDHCQLTSVFLSEQDQEWTRAVFTRQPWGFCHIFGLDVQGRQVQGQFGFEGGRMIQRGFHLIPEYPASLSGGSPSSEVFDIGLDDMSSRGEGEE